MAAAANKAAANRLNRLFPQDNATTTRLSPVPLISPSQRAIGAQAALHTIFSPMGGPSQSQKQQPHPPRRPPTSAWKTPRSRTGLSVVNAATSPSCVSSLGGSPFSNVTLESSVVSSSSSTYKGLSNIGMISVDYIQQCQSLDQLRQIVLVLQSEPNCKSLLGLARKRQIQVQQQGPNHSAANGRAAAGPPVLISPVYEEIAAVQPQRSIYRTSSSNCGKQIQNQSLNMSLSSDETEDIVAPPVQTSAPPISSDYKLYKEVERLTAALKENDEEHRKQEEAHLKRIEDLKRTHKHSTFQLESLENLVSTSKVTTTELTQKLEDIRKENKKIHARLEAECAEHAQSRETVEALEQTLEGKLKELEESQRAFGEQDTKFRKSLKSVWAELDQIKRDRDELVRQLREASTVAGTPHSTPKDGKQVVQDVVAILTESKSSIRTLTKDRASLKHDRDRIAKENSALEESLREVETSRRGVERENKRLVRQVQDLTRDLKTSRTRMEKEIETTRARSKAEWEKRENMYKDVVRSLKEKISQQELPAATKSNVPTRPILKTKNHGTKPLSVTTSLPSEEATSRKVAFVTPMRVAPFAAEEDQSSPSCTTPRSLSLSRQLRAKSPKRRAAPPPPPPPPPPPKTFTFGGGPPPPQKGSSRPSSLPRQGIENVPPPKRVTIVAPQTNLYKEVDGSFCPIAKSPGKAQARMNLIRKQGGKKLGVRDKFQQARSPTTLAHR